MSSTKDKENFNAIEVVKCLHHANQLALKYHHQYVTLEHLLAALLEQPDVQEVVTTFKVDPKSLADEVARYLEADFVPISDHLPIETDVLNNCIRFAVGQVMFSARKRAMPIDLLVGILQQQGTHAQAFLNNAGITALEVKKLLSHGGEEVRQVAAQGTSEVVREVATKEEAIEVLGKYCVNLNDQAKASKIDPLIGRENEVTQIIQIASRRTKNNSVLVGEPGTGKTQIAEGLALKIANQQVPEVIADAVVYALDTGNLIAGTRFRGDIEERVKNILKALTFIEKPILFIDEVHNIIGAGSSAQSSMDVSNLLKPALAKGALRCIGSTTYEEYRKHFEKDRALQRRFRKVDVIEPSVADTKLILRGLRAYYEDYHKLIYADAALDAAAELTARYVQNQYLPDKAIDVIDAAGARQRIADPAVRKTMVDVEDIELEVSELAKIPMRTVLEGEKEKLQRLSGDLSTHIFGQDKAIQTLTDAVQIARAGLREPNKPAGSYLFAGPSGVGKTEVARRLAKTLSIELIKFDMSEYMEKHSVSRLIGAPPGYVGHGEGGAGAGLLTNAIERAPHCVLLLDEIEKAHPDIFNVLLQVMDDAVLTNSQGKPIHFENVIIIMTTNAGAADMIRPAIGFGDPQRTGEDDTAIQKLFTPEFRNRLDAVVKFDSLQPEHMKLVTNKFVAELAERVAPKGVTLHLTPKAREWLAKKGYDPQMGARPLARVIEEKVKRPLARLMLFGALEKGGTATIAVANDDLVLTTP